MDSDKKRKFNPWTIEKSFTQETRSKHAFKRSKTNLILSLKSQTTKQSKNPPTLRSFSFPQYNEMVEVEILAYNKNNQGKGLLYIHGYNIPDNDDFYIPEDRVKLLECAKSGLDKSSKYYFHSTPTDFQRKWTIKIHRSPRIFSKI